MGSEAFLVNSTFLLLALKDVKMPHILLRISRCMKLITTEQVIQEVERNLRKAGLESMLHYLQRAIIEVYDPLNDSRILEGNPVIIHRPFLGYGEFSLLLLFWYLWYRRQVHELFLVTDDRSARRYIEKNVSEIPKDRILWSLKFMDTFVVNRCGISRREFIELLNRLEESSFRIDKRILAFYRKKYGSEVN